MPRSTSWALDRLRRPEISSQAVAGALISWRRYSQIPRGPRRWQKDPVAEGVGTYARTTLEAAMFALEPRRAEPLRRVVDRLDRAFLAATVPDPSVDARLYWWQRRDWF